MNQVLDPIVETYIKHFGTKVHPIIWEVGSRDGRDAAELAERVQTDGFALRARITCLEPNPRQAEIIRESYPQARVIEKAASDRSGQAEFMVYEGDEGAVGSSSLDLRWKEDDLSGHVIKVRTIRLDTLLSTTIVDIMKIDVEGHSLPVLKGLGEKLGQIRVLHVETEDWTGSDKAVIGYLGARGWRLTDERQEWPGMPDLTFVNTLLL